MQVSQMPGNPSQLCRARVIVILAGCDFDRDMAQAVEPCQTLFVDSDGLRPIGDNGDDRGPVPRSDLPQMEVGNPVSIDFDKLANFVFGLPIRNGVDQHGAGIADEAVGPACNHAGTHESDNGIDPDPAEGPCGNQASDSEH